ncbi:B-cell receptor CD22-like [Eublepharis macularius]|uniref:B-cell receptor CD22 n=1 Tax=Eublepharis macularius TaxID=481883 RepID=A0AA97KJ03_EUBMA|nr:B-cell receptor CD22-like [Eublepharis macularius]XP_054855714.1 B-cell receptor CD22-like [Eublepharis macularius]
MKHFVWLLFFPGFLCNLNPRNRNPLTIRPDSLVTWEGSCVLIPCEIGRYGGAVLNPITLLWYFQPFYDMRQSEYNGVLLYNSSMASGYSNTHLRDSQDRVKFVGNLNHAERKTCSLKISQVRTEDNGIYGARLFASYSRPTQQHKWFLNATIHVAESPPAPIMDVSPTYIRESLVRVTCSVTYHCPDDPLRVVIGLEKNHLPSQRMTTINGVIKTVVSFRVTWEDHRKNLFCSLERQDRSEISKSTKQLDVNYAPKGVQLIALPGTTIQEGQALSLECTIKSSNPEVYEYCWYKDLQLMYGCQNQSKIEFEAKGDQHSGVYTCEAKNSVGSQKSEELHIDVQSHSQDTSTHSASESKPTAHDASAGASDSRGDPAGPSCSSSEEDSEEDSEALEKLLLNTCKELTSAVVELTEQLRKARSQIKILRQRTCVSLGK